ncbi:MAG: ribosome biogenesis GTPase Der [Burkholderiaceae bacterium]|nr:ribosome biogenesis GTPase Der [Burkholderiaceae bacterium]
MLPVVALVGRPNVGKSTLFNRLTRSRAALVADFPGLTRDRQYGRGRLGAHPFIVVDTGGFEPIVETGVMARMARQTRQAVIESDVVIFIVDGREGLTAHDMEIANELRRTAARVLLAVNKAEGRPREQVVAEFHELGLGEPLAVSATHGDGVRDLVDEALQSALGEAFDIEEPTPPQSEDAPEAPRELRVAVVGRPNAGKSTLINTLLGEERLVAFDEPGTTRDSVEIEFERDGRAYVLVDTAGVRRRARVHDAIEKFSVIKTLQAIEDSNVCVLLLDPSENIAEQDAVIASHVLEAGRAVVVAVNKWDSLDREHKDMIRRELDRKLHFLGFAKIHMISALKGTGIGAMMRSVNQAYDAAMRKLPTPKLTRALHEAVERQAPPRKGPVRPKLRYAHQGGQNPPIIVIHGNALDAVPASYRRYLEGWFRDKFSLVGTPLRVEFRVGSNPYADQRA